uniref:Cupin type-1 domain-containing protein n=2 Tax=Chenopodium quinoa TaxID=63459 RepID=A0A803M125_CHEQI
MYPESKEEKVVKLEKGDTIVVPSGVVSWWFNAGNDELKIIYLGETHNAINPGNFTYGSLAGAIGILKGFSNKTIANAYGISNEQANELVNTQKEALILKLEQGLTMPKPSNYDLTKEFDEGIPHFQVKKGGSIRFLTSEKQSTLEGIKLCGKLLKLDPNAMFGPIYYAQDSGVELSYVTKGSGWVQIVGLNGQIALDTKLEAGQLFAVPKFYVVAVGAGEEGIECFSIVTTSKPILAQIAGNMSFWKTMSPQVLQASLNVSPKFCELVMDKIENTTIIMPPN